jgi:hypothetical protein
MHDNLNDIIEQMRRSPRLAPLAEALVTLTSDEVHDGTEFPDLDLTVRDLNPVEHDLLDRAMRAVASLMVGELTPLISGEIPRDVTVGNGDAPAGEDVAVALGVAAQIASEIGGDDPDRVVKLLNIGFADSLVHVEAQHCDRTLTGLDRDWAIVEAARQVTEAAASTAAKVLASIHDGDPVTIAEVSAAVDAPMVGLLRLFPDIVDTFTEQMVDGIDAGIEDILG